MFDHYRPKQMWEVEVYQECGRFYVMQTLAMV
jgi:hypothetical protein